ncbi:hydroxypyruvate isomerase family protein [Amycolatopsis sp. YIM 10]|uniref:hydroxypyruvate isomerase family protein n=1 Tax=Amycolatopsis sp. YIM 10 TaxID=2653857 RepID=UPI00129054B9|nr:TIM barrel protein [Amycolatopsis sp. YIM 10]QFU88443.1 Hydroxypyruvate isomerase [Amycolatopsis sp. YIM 10]
MRFAANLKWLFAELPFERRFDAAAAAGFTGVECPSPYSVPAAELKRRLDDAGLTQVLINTPGIACAPDRTTEFRDGFHQALDYATELNCGLVHVLAGARPDGVGHDRAFAQFATNIAWAAERSRDTGVRLVLEAQNKRDSPGFVLASQAQAAAVAEAAGHDHVGLLFDVYHVQLDERDLVNRLRAFLPRIFHLQLADPPSRTEPGTGEIGWPVLFATLREAGYDGWIGCEYRPTTDIATTLTRLEELARCPASR